MVVLASIDELTDRSADVRNPATAIDYSLPLPLLMTVASDAWEIEVLTLAVIPLDEVGRLTVLMANLKNNAVAIRRTHPMPAHHDPVTNFREHAASCLLPRRQLSTSDVASALGTEVTEIARGDRSPRRREQALGNWRFSTRVIGEAVVAGRDVWNSGINSFLQESRTSPFARYSTATFTPGFTLASTGRM